MNDDALIKELKRQRKVIGKTSYYWGNLFDRVITQLQALKEAQNISARWFAVVFVDAQHGHTCEFASSPTAHKQEYDLAEIVAKDIFAQYLAESVPKAEPATHAENASVQMLPCPFCGAAAEIEPWHGGAPTKIMISCSDGEYNCDICPTVVGETREEAISRWNMRTQPKANEPTVDEQMALARTVMDKNKNVLRELAKADEPSRAEDPWLKVAKDRIAQLEAENARLRIVNKEKIVKLHD